MIPVGRLKSNLQFNKNLGDLVEVMKLAATSQFNQFRSKEEPSEDFIRLLDDVFGVLLSSGAENDLLTPKDHLPALLFLVSSDEGFLGELNFLLVNKLLSARRQEDIVAVAGQQGANYLKEIQINFSFFDSPGEKVDVQLLARIRDYLLSQYLERKVGRVYVVYSRFLNITSQQVELEVLLPLPQARGSSRPIPHLLIEPDPEKIIEGWIKAWLDFRLFQIFWSAKLAEFAARIMHLEGSVQELGRINSHLRMEYFKYLHSLSDKSIRELTAARLIGRAK
ncbi:MAG: F0F1 ATP synthase subunit gamma [Candidatus Omnitrophica bacterium]|jgi:ATP synthase F1 gamma subunit|nr:F0F1 ATP synthase subunit gamma [Candidatus Omnitrophota bacterium]MDD5661239.1 F0F1 ATP synthase subunit gamma [Candidatus Omnitrophota bacterium]